jgi:Putative peptidoglycan binding domain/Heterokaryon incompatibility protein Het-C
VSTVLFETPLIRRSPPDEPVHIGHGLTIPPSLRADAIVDETDAFASGPHGHEGIESVALTQVFGQNPALLRQIYLGNWSRDLSQTICPVLFDKLGPARGAQLSNLIFEVLDVRAEATFGRRLSRRNFGTYRWEEHIDNPRCYGIALHPTGDGPNDSYRQGRNAREDEPDAFEDFWMEDARLGIANYIMAARRYAIRQFLDAIRAGKNPRGYELLGNGLHTVEDFFAHSNFVELAMNLLDGTTNPGTGWLTADSSRAPIRDSKGRYRIITGVFFLEDTAISLEKLLMQQLETHDPGARSDADRKTMRVIVRRTLGDTAANAYWRLTEAWESAQNQLGIRLLQETFDRTIKQPVRLALAALLRPITSASVLASQRRSFSTPIANGPAKPVTERAHSSIAKDDHLARYHREAKALAGAAAVAFAREVNARWVGGGQGDPARFEVLMDQYVNHPAAVSWWRSLLSGGSVAPPGPRPTPPGPRPAPGPAPAPGRPMLRSGARGPAVADLQRRLNAWSQATRSGPQLVVDGAFGWSTDSAVRRFQRARGLAPDGIVGPRTWSSLAQVA